MPTRKSSIFYGLLIAVVSVVGGMILASRLDLAPGSFANALSVPATNSAPLSGPIDAATFRNIAKEASPSVVTVKVITTRPANEAPDDLFGLQLPFPFGNNRGGGQGGQQRAPREVPLQGEGSGFIIDKSGHILTNNHVVENAKSIEVFLSNSDSEGLAAKVIGRDQLSDTALIQLTEMPRDPLEPAKFGDSDQMAPGDWVMAIGNPFGLSNSVTVGVVSAVGRHNQVAPNRFADFIQTDAAINRGNSGGPLLNLRGEVIGINTMIFTTPESGGANIGLGFAIPINTVRDLLPQLHDGKVSRGRIGVGLDGRNMTRDEAEDLGLGNGTGALVRQVAAGGPAANAGLKVGDVITEFNGKAVRNNDELVSAVTRTAAGTTVPMKVMRDKKSMTLNVKVEELDLAQEQAQAGARGRSGGAAPEAEPTDTGFGMLIQPVQPREARGMQVPSGRGGAIVTDVTPLGPAQMGGLAEGDVILTVQGQNVHSVDEVTRALSAVPAGRTVRLVVWRFENGQGQETLVQIRKR